MQDYSALWIHEQIVIEALFPSFPLHGPGFWPVWHSRNRADVAAAEGASRIFPWADLFLV